MAKKFYVTTPIYYPNDIPHIGHAYTTIAADVLARWHKINGDDVFFLTGTDENAKKVYLAAQKKGVEIKKFVDTLAEDFKDAWKKLDIKYDRFFRTTDKDHGKVVLGILEKTHKKGEIYKGVYEGFYCTGCEAYYTEKDLEDGKCPIHKTKAELMKEESYFFKLSEYQEKLLEFYEKNPDFISPKSRRNEIINRVKEGLKDLSISRKDYGWGIKLPFDKSHVVYVWYDALVNYYTATRKKGKEKYWPADVHLVGKDILWFHAVIWPAMLLSLGIELPKKVFAHGWWTFNKEKISKSRGKIVNVDELISIAGVDAARYFLLRATPFGDDGDFSEKALVDRYNNELADKLGNLVSRVSALAEKYGVEKFDYPLYSDKKWEKDVMDGKVDVDEVLNIDPKENFHVFKKSDERSVEGLLFGSYFKLRPTLKLILLLVDNQISGYKFDKALNTIFAFIDNCNKFIQKRKIWENKDESKTRRDLYELVYSIRGINPYLGLFMPKASKKIGEIFKTDKIKKAPVLFEKIK